MMQIRYQCNLQDYLEAQAASCQRSVVYWIFFGAVGLLLVSRGTYQYFALGDPRGVPFVMIIAVWAVLRFIVRPYYFKRDFRKHPNFSLQTEKTIDEDGIQSSSETGQATTKWAAFQCFRETSNLVLLYSGARVFQVIPKRAFTSEQLREFGELIRRKMPPK